jgi:hypothetical protein
MTQPKECNASTFAYALGTAAAERAAQQLDLICAREKDRIQRINEPEINASKLRLGFLRREWGTLLDTLSQLPMSPLSLQRRRLYFFALAALLSLAGLVAAHFALSPFGMGYETWVFSSGLAVVGGFWTHVIIEKYHASRMIDTLFIGAFGASLAGLAILAVLRGDMLTLYLQAALAGATGEITTAASTTDGSQFYAEATQKLRWFFALLTIAMELAMGLAVYEARKTGATSKTEADDLRKRVKAIEEEIASVVGRLTFLENEPSAFEAEFLRNAALGCLDAVSRGSLIKFTNVAAMALFVALAPTIFAQRMSVVVGIDFSASENTDHRKGASAHDQDVAATARLISQLPPGTKVMIGGITDQSFGRPVTLVATRIPTERGPLPFLDQIAITRSKMAAQLSSTANALPTHFQRTDVLGFAMLAAEEFQQSPQDRHVLIFLSDMRHSSTPVNIETPALVGMSAFKVVERQHFLANLRGVDVYVLGAHAAGKSVPYWQSLREFYTIYFKACGADLRSFSVTRDLPDLSATSKGAIP